MSTSGQPGTGYFDEQADSALIAARDALLTRMLRLMAGLGFISLLVVISVGAEARVVVAVVVIVLLLALLGYARILFRRELPFSVRAIAFWLLFYMPGLLLMRAGGMFGDGRLLLTTFPIVVAALFGLRAALLSAVVAIVTVFGVGWALASGLIVPVGGAVDVALSAGNWLFALVISTMMGVLLLFSLGRVLENLQFTLDRASQLNEAMDGERRRLERRVAYRNQALETSAAISRRLTAILDPRALIAEVVNEVQRGFDYYHVQMYLQKKPAGTLELVGATSDVGQQLLRQRHSVMPGRGLTGRAAASRQTSFAPAVVENPLWLPNPLLPFTASEIAVPIVAGNHVVGVLDVQQDGRRTLTEDDIVMLENVAAQVAVALQNAQAYEAVQRQAEMELQRKRIGELIRETRTIEQALQSAVAAIGSTIPAQRAALLVGPLDEDRG